MPWFIKLANSIKAKVKQNIFLTHFVQTSRMGDTIDVQMPAFQRDICIFKQVLPITSVPTKLKKNTGFIMH